jgi:hypothetical protein
MLGGHALMTSLDEPVSTEDGLIEDGLTQEV